MYWRSNVVRFSCCGWLLCAIVASIGCESQPDEPLAHEPMEEVQTQKAVAGVGKRGKSLEDNTGVAKIISGPASTYFKLEQKAVLEWQIPQALQLFKATEGRNPKSHAEFLQRIVKANRLQLPELPPGAEYRFHPDSGELWVHPIEKTGETTGSQSGVSANGGSQMPANNPAGGLGGGRLPNIPGR